MKDIFKKLEIDEAGFGDKLLADMVLELKSYGKKAYTIDKQKIEIENLILVHLNKVDFFDALRDNKTLLKRYIIQLIAIANNDFFNYFWVLNLISAKLSDDENKIDTNYTEILEFLFEALLSTSDTYHKANLFYSTVKYHDKVVAKDAHHKAFELAASSKEYEELALGSKYKDEEFYQQAHQKAIELAKTGEDYAYLGNWQKAIELGTDERYLFWISSTQRGPLFEEAATEMLEMILEHEKKNSDSHAIATMANNMYEDADIYFSRDEDGETDCDIDTFGDIISSWSEQLMKLATQKSTTKEDEDYINELLGYQGYSIEDYR